MYSRTRDFYHEFAAVLSKADVVYLCDLYPAREQPIPGVSSALIAIAMLPLMIALCLEVYLLGRVILHQQGLSIAVASLLLIVFASLWFVFPFAMRLIRERGR